MDEELMKQMAPLMTGITLSVGMILGYFFGIFRARFRWIVIGLIVLIIGLGANVWLANNGPEAKKKPHLSELTGVQVMEVKKENVQVKLETEGVVSARQETRLSAEVGGRVEEVSDKFAAGLELTEGEVILRIDPANYQAALANAESALADAELALKTEESRTVQALRDWKKLGRGGEPSEMVKRTPHLTSARARVASAEAMRHKALLDVARTEIVAPYACRVRLAMVDLGTIIAPGTPLGEIYEVGDYEVRLPLSLEDYGYLKKGASVEFTATVSGRETKWKGRVIRREGDINRETLSAYVVANVEENAQAAEGFRLPPPGLFLKAVVEGEMIQDIFVIPRAALRGRDQLIILDEDDRLAFRKVKIVRGTKEKVYVTSGLKTGDRVCLTKVERPIEGAQLKIIEEENMKDSTEETEEKN